MRKTLLTGVTLAAMTCHAQASIIAAANLFASLPPVGASTVVVRVQGVTTPSQTTFTGSGYTINFNVDANQGIVQGSVPSIFHAVPVAGVTATGSATYLTGDFGSAQTTNPLLSGNYLSIGTGTITITFAVPETSFALLWGSIDASNAITFNDVARDSLTGTQVQTLAAGFAGNGYQGPAGSAYVNATTDTPFTSVTLSSGVVSFEAAGIAASTVPFSSIPEPATLALLGAGLLGTGLACRRRR